VKIAYCIIYLIEDKRSPIHFSRLRREAPLPIPVESRFLFDLRCQFDSTQRHSRITELLESEHGIVSLLDSPVILLYQVVQILIGPYFYLSRQYSFSFQFSDSPVGRFISIGCNLLGRSIISQGLLEEATGSCFIPILAQQEINGPAMLINRAIKIAPLPFKTFLMLTDSVVIVATLPSRRRSRSYATNCRDTETR